MRQALSLAGILLIFYSCNPNVKDQKDVSNYFDLKGYFEKEAVRLTKSKPVITKMVTVNDSTETKKISIADWKKELSVFSDADINRSAWKGLFKVRKDIGKEIYTSNNKKVPVKELLILKQNNKVYGIRIIVENSNIIYSSGDTLSYYPDSLYQIKKKQQIKLLSEKNYSITGKFE